MSTISKQEWAAAIDWLAGMEKEGSADDIEGRRALARVLRHEPPLGVLVQLANLIDPDMRDTMLQWLAFKRAPGRRKKIGTRQIAAVVWEQIQAGEKREAAYRYAADKLRVSFSTAQKAMAEWEEHFLKHGSKWKSLTRPSN